MRRVRIGVCAYLMVACFLMPTGRGRSQEPYRVAVVQSRDLAAYDEVIASFRTTLEGQRDPIRVSQYSLVSGSAGISRAAERLRRDSPDLILALGTVAAAGLAGETLPSPLLYTMVLDPASAGLTGTIPRVSLPLAGVSMDIPPARLVELMATILPSVRTVGVLYSGGENKAPVRQAQAAARDRAMTLHVEEILRERDVPRALETLSLRAGAFLALPDRLVYSETSLRYILLHSLRQSQPLVGAMEAIVKGGAVGGLALDYKDIGAQTAEMVVRIRAGAPTPAGVVEPPRKLRVLLNLRSARRLGMALPPQVLRGAEVLVR